MALNYREVAEILKLIDASECEEVTLELEGVRLSVRKAASGTAPVAASASTSSPSLAPLSGKAEKPTTSSAANAPSDGTVAIRAPMVGTFYRRPEPNKDPFVEIGSSVQAGDPLCMIEVMKLFTTIEAAQAGIIRQIAVEDAGMVEFDQVMFSLEPT